MKRTKMKEVENWRRRDFTLKSALLILSSVPITIAACGDSGSPSSPTPTPTPTPSTGNVQGVVSANHGHTATITSAQLTAANALSLDITGSANHPHTVALTAAEVGQIAQNMNVQKTSTSNTGHTHAVTFN